MLAANQRLGDFEIVRLLGKGGMGEVYEARQNNPERLVALKVLAPWLSNDDAALQRFWREAKVPANLDHPGIVRIISTGKTDDGLAYYTMHLVRGVTLSEMIRQGKDDSSLAASRPPTLGEPTFGASEAVETPQSPVVARPVGPEPPTEDHRVPMVGEFRSNRYGTVARIGAQAARALAHAHQRGFMHRDIKPANLMVDQHDHVYLLDFGLTKGLEQVGDVSMSGVVGTPCYMSPEQANGEELDPRADVYSLGITLFELCTLGQGPITANRQDKAAVLRQIRSGAILSHSLSTLAPGIPADLERIIRKAIDPDKEKRHDDAAELARELEGAAPASSPDDSTRPLGLVNLPPRRRSWWGAAATGFGVAALIVFLTAAVWPRLRENAEAPPVVRDGREAFPESLRGAVPDTPIALLKVNCEPAWKQLMCGKGMTTLWPNKQLELFSRRNEKITMLALADPNRPRFDFAVEMNPLGGVESELGVFFGWRRNPPDPDGHHRFFMVKLEQMPIDEIAPYGQLTVGSGSYIENRKERLEGGTWFTPFNGNLAVVPLPRPKPWHSLKLRVDPDRFTIFVGLTIVRVFNLTDLRHEMQVLDPNLATEGAVGIWTRHGRSFFRNATVTVLGPQ